MQQIGISRLWFITSIILLCFPLTFPISSGQQLLWGNEWTGPWIDKIIYRIIPPDEECVEALLNGNVDIIGGQIEPKYLDQLENAENIQVFNSLRFGHGITYFNCMKYPMNITNFRRAVAFALDKHRIINEGLLGYGELLDCHIPRQHPACIEDEMGYHYYDEQIEKAIELIEAAGFIDTDDDGWREGPGPEGPGTIELDTLIVEGFPTAQIDIFVDTVVQALFALNISAEARQTSFYPSSLCPGVRDRDMWYIEYDWNDFDLDHYARDMSSDYLTVMNMNYPNWSNETWDALVPIILESLDYNEIIATAKQMEKIWVHACPAIVMYQNDYITAFRDDRFTGFVESIYSGASNFYSNLRVHKKSGNVIGGNLYWANPLDILSFNHYSVNSRYARNILDMLFDELVKIGPDGNDVNWLCEDFTVLTHYDNASVPEGHTRILVDVIQNATWSDGTPITAEDIAFTLSFLLNHVPVAGVDLVDMVTCYAPTTYELFCEFSSESYWHWHNIAYQSIIPRQVWFNHSDAYDEYQPNPSTILDMVVSSAFKPTMWVQGDYTELEQNENYWKNPRKFAPETTISSEYTTNGTTSSFDLSSFTNATLVTVGTFSCLVIVGVIVLRMRSKGTLID